MEIKSFGKAILLAPIAAPAIYFALLVIVIPFAPESVVTNIAGLIFYGAKALPMGYIGAILIMLPGVTLLKTTNRLTVTNLVISGFISGAVLFPMLVSYITHYYLSYMITSPHIAWYLIPGGAMGVGVAYYFSLISGITKPSKV